MTVVGRIQLIKEFHIKMKIKRKKKKLIKLFYLTGLCFSFSFKYCQVLRNSTCTSHKLVEFKTNSLNNSQCFKLPRRHIMKTILQLQMLYNKKRNIFVMCFTLSTFCFLNTIIIIYQLKYIYLHYNLFFIYKKRPRSSN